MQRALERALALPLKEHFFLGNRVKGDWRGNGNWVKMIVVSLSFGGPGGHTGLVSVFAELRPKFVISILAM